MSSNTIQMSPVRRSGRSRKVNDKYVNDGWNKETLRLLRESSESSNPTSVSTNDEPEVTDGEFDERAIQQISTTVADAADDNLSIASGSARSSSDSASRLEEDGDNASTTELGEGDQRVKKQRVKKPATTLRSRGIFAAERGKSARSGVWQLMFGPEVEDLRPMVFAKDVWLHNTRDVTLPSRISMLEARKRTLRERIESNRLNHSDQGRRSSSDSLIITEAPPSTLSVRQRLKPLSHIETRRRLFLVDGNDHKIVMGPWSQQQQYDLPYLKSADIGQAWRKRGDTHGSSHHSGWSVNLGEKPLQAAWSPTSVHAQYLAIACRSTPQQRDSVPKVETSKTPAFSPTPSYPNGIQIWKFSTKSGQLCSTMDFEVQPQLVAILACSYGDVKKMSWLSNLVGEKGDHTSDLGTLALVTSDGCFRLIHVSKLNLDGPLPTCLEVITPSVEIRPPADAVFTCFTFSSTSDIILGASSGHIYLYNLLQAQEKHDKIEPYYSFQLQQTYIMALCTIPDENYSHFLGSCSAAGTIQITDLRSPTQDTLAMTRARIPTRNLICSAQTRAFITTIDSSGNTEPRGNAQTTVVAHNIRHFYTSMALSKFPEGSGTATTLAGSSHHPSILMGNSGGNVWAQNVVRRILPTGKPGARNDGGAWIQKIVEYEWIAQPSNISAPSQPYQPHTSSNTTNAAVAGDKPTIDLHHGRPVRPGISRLHHGFKPERLDLSNTGSKKRKAAASGPNGESAIQVIFEDEQAVTALAWNENPLASTWCVIGWGSGVVLVMDLAHDAK